jgi:hypothetical protein
VEFAASTVPVGAVSTSGGAAGTEPVDPYGSVPPPPLQAVRASARAATAVVASLRDMGPPGSSGRWGAPALTSYTQAVRVRFTGLPPAGLLHPRGRIRRKSG